MLNLDSRSRSKLAWIATLLTPVVAVQGVRLATGMSTSSASAATAPAAADAAPTPITGEAEKPLTPAQAEAVKWLLARSATLPRRSPMDRPDQAPPPTPQPEVHMERPHAPEPMKTPTRPRWASRSQA